MRILDLPKRSRRYQPTGPGQTWLIDIYALLPQNVSFLECFWRSHIYFIRYRNNPTEITRNHFYDVFLWRIFDKPKILTRDFFETSWRHGKDIFLRYFWDVLKLSHKRQIFWNILEFFEMYLRRLKDITKKTSLLRCFWEVSEKSLNGDLIEISQRHLMPAG